MMTTLNAKNLSEIDISAAIDRILLQLLEPVAELELIKRKLYLSEKEVEKLYGIAPATLRTLRCRHKGPHFSQRSKGDPVRYKHEDIQCYLSTNRIKR